MIWGGSFVLLFCILVILSFIQYLFLKKSFRKNTPDFPFPSTCNSGENFSVYLEAFIPFLFPGFRCIWKTELPWVKGGRTLSSNCSLRRGNRIYCVLFEMAQRGVYRGPSGTVILEDLFGFTRFSLFTGGPVIVHIYPQVQLNEFKKEKIITGGEAATAERNRIRTNELLEVRKYYPGDDARRINWKMFAASGQLFLRIGEEIPPPTGEAAIVLNSFSPAVGALRESASHTDLLVASYLSFVYSFVEKGCIVRVLVPGMRDFIEFDTRKPDVLFRILSEVTSADSLDKIPERDFLYVLSHPRSDFLKQLAALRTGEVKVFIKSLPEIHRKNYYRQLFFRESDQSGLSPGEFRAYRELEKSAGEDAANLKKAGKGKIHCEIL